MVASTLTAPGKLSANRIPRRRVDGVLLLDKPRGVTSNAALLRVKRLYNAEKAGHTGTLDPLASGLLPICFGSATRFAQFLLDAPKRYVATVRLVSRRRRSMRKAMSSRRGRWPSKEARSKRRSRVSSAGRCRRRLRIRR